MDDKCKCTLRETAVGDGCRYCNPQYLINILIEQQFEYEKEVGMLRDALERLYGCAKLILAGKPCRDVPETFGEVEQALKDTE